jgi:peroxiredoxin
VIGRSRRAALLLCCLAPALWPAPGVADSGEPLAAWTGGELPALTLTDVGGAPFDWQQYRGKVLVVNFWATWCEPCRAEMPSLQRLRTALRGQPFEVLGISVGDARASVERFVARLEIDFPIALDADKSQIKRWRVGVLPTTFIVDQRGQIRFRHVGGRDWDDETVIRAVTGLLNRP